MNKINVRVSASMAEQLSGENTRARSQSFNLFELLNLQMDARQVQRVFPDAGKFEAAHRSFGLHLWYEIEFADSVDHEINQLLQYYQQLPDIQAAEPVYPMSFDVMPQPSASTNDPRFSDQWNYHNTGQTGGTAGADISLKDAWDLEKGSKEVVVAVIDGGIQTDHEDLANVLWVNQAEANGTEGVDDDHNGYVDDIHGYGFGDRRGSFSPHFHGTHVAGTIGAVSNNGLGVSGIAGGDGNGDGIRLMTCAVFGSNSQGGFPQAFIYAADNGAVIAQNSWGGGSKSAVLEDAIDYFIARAGYDNSEENYDQNIQIGPMAGGLVFFSAGNNSSSVEGYPAAYEPVIAVASTDHHDQLSIFSNYGEWVDIAAPGTDILSTYTGNGYNYLSGTSMACPHVSGVAALIISRYQSPGLGPDLVKSLILGATDPIDHVNQEYTGLIGAGRINASKALNFDDEGKPPAPVTDLKIESMSHNTALLQWTATGNDGQKGQAAYYDIRYATKPITESNFSSAIKIMQLPKPVIAGTVERFEVSDLPINTQLYFALKAYDFHQDPSAMSNTVGGKTKEPPVMKVLPASLSVTLNSGDSVTKILTIDNQEGKSHLIYDLSVIRNTSSINQRADNRKNVLLIRHSKSYGKDAEIVLKNQYGITPDIISHQALPSHDLQHYDLVIVSLQNSANFYQTISEQKEHLEAYLENGGVVLYQIRGNISLPGGLRTLNATDHGNQDLNILEHPITQNAPEEIPVKEYYRYFFQDVPANGKTLTTTDKGALPTTVTYDYSNGEVIATTLPLDYLYNYGYEGGTMLPDAIDYALFQATPNRWLRMQTGKDTLGASQATRIPIELKASRMIGGDYFQNIVISSNDPDNPESTVPVQLTVVGEPEILIAHDTIDFAKVFTHYPHTDTLEITNTGTDTLIVSNLSLDNEMYHVETTPLKIPAYRKGSIPIRFEPTAAGLYQGTLTLSTNDQDHSTYEILLTGTAEDPPVITTNPDSIFIRLNQGDKVTSILEINNQGKGAALNYSLQTNYTQFSPVGTPESGTNLSEKEVLSLASAPEHASNLVVDTQRNFIYSFQQEYNSTIYQYQMEENQWTTLTSGEGGDRFLQDAVIIGDKIFTLYYNYASEYGIQAYDLLNQQWTNRIAFDSGQEAASISTDQTYLYILFKDGTMAMYDTSLQSQKELTAIYLKERVQDLIYFDQHLYAHTPGKLLVYQIASDSWQSLPAPPFPLSSTSAASTQDRTLHFTSGENWLEYDIDNQIWYTASNPLLTRSNTYLAGFNDDKRSGIYFLQDSIFSLYNIKSNDSWLSYTIDIGSIQAQASQQVPLQITAENLLSGHFQGVLTIDNNDPEKPQYQIPVDLNVDRIDTINHQPPQLTDSIKTTVFNRRESAYNLNLSSYFHDPEGYPLTFYARSENEAIVQGTIDGGILSIFTVGTGKTALHLQAKDIDGLTLNYQFDLEVSEQYTLAMVNQAPEVLPVQKEYSIRPGNRILISLDSLFQDPEGALMTFSGTSSDPTTTSVEILTTGEIQVQAIQPEASIITITATDPWGEQASLALTINKYQEPISLESLPDSLTLERGDSLVLMLRQYISSEQTSLLSYRIAPNRDDVIQYQLRSDSLIIQAIQAGQATLYLEVSNSYADTAAFSLAIEVTDKVLAIEKAVVPNLSLTVYPNPVRHPATISYSINRPTHVQLQIYNAAGILIQTLVQQEQSAGYQEIGWPTQLLSAGTYLVRLITDEEQVSIRVIR